MNSIAIIDCFASNQKIVVKLHQQISRLKSIGLDVLLISNTPVESNVLSQVDFFLYDKRNQLFECEYGNVLPVVFTSDVSNGEKIVFKTKMIKPGLQRHGLSVLCNFHNAVNFAKSVGYRNFWRFEVDDEFGEESLQFIKRCPELTSQLGKKSILYYNHYESEPNNISFHFQFWDIDFFLEKIPQIKDEVSYIDYLQKTYGNLDFETAEQFIYNNIVRNDDSSVLIKDGSKMEDDFPDTTWNTIQSTSNLSPKYRNCVTTLFEDENSDNLILLTRNSSTNDITRRIRVNYKESTSDFIHHVPVAGSWSYNLLGNKYSIVSIDVFQGDEFLYTEENKNIQNYIEFL